MGEELKEATSIDEAIVIENKKRSKLKIEHLVELNKYINFDRVIELMVSNYSYFPIVMQVSNNLIFRDKTIPKTEIQSFMDRKIVLVKERHKIRG